MMHGHSMMVSVSCSMELFFGCSWSPGSLAQTGSAITADTTVLATLTDPAPALTPLQLHLKPTLQNYILL